MTTPAIVPPLDDVLARWQAAIRANREQVERVRQGPERSDFYAPVATAFAGDPNRTGDPVLEQLRQLVRPGETVLDIGAGGGRYALPLAKLASEVIAVEPSQAMRRVLGEAMERHGVRNIRVVASAWPMEDAPQADVALASHVGYDIEPIAAFLDAMEAAARRLCIAVFAATAPSDQASPLWEAVYGEPRARLPALPEFLTLQLARGRLFEVRLATLPRPTYPDFERALEAARFRTWVTPGSEGEQRLAAALRARLRPAPGGGLESADPPLTVGVVSWAPR
ncbi:MAG: methyltransferase domain-containing protein [Chloroflexota bacterium]|nr:methyltransferase domain-containing protein [Dehalococcoidia bacterium]MDW8047129.1 methyltransferase domain-containing protein [Chloroflexota bacterium]